MKKFTLCVFCGSSDGTDPAFTESASRLGTLIADRSVDLVYGGGNAGVMGHCARAALKGHARVTGIIPKKIHALVDHVDLTELFIVETMHERKAKMHDLADSFAVLPGGIGTLEEFFEAFTWFQLGYHQKPIALLNTAGYFDGLIAFLIHMSGAGFLDPATLSNLIVEKTPEALLDRISAAL
jgi:uncharacterized protein (TIGR00730 family)